MFIGSTYWRGNFSRKDLRIFESAEAAWKHFETEKKEEIMSLFENGHLDHPFQIKFIPDNYRVYEVFSDKAPRLCKYQGTFESPVEIDENRVPHIKFNFKA